MKVQLQIKRKDLDLIKEGTKRTEWRLPSKYNKQKLFVPREEDGKLIGNEAITEIEFINGYSKDRETFTIGVTRIRMVKFSRNVDIPEDNFHALEGQFAIEISLSEIVK